MWAGDTLEMKQYLYALMVFTSGLIYWSISFLFRRSVTETFIQPHTSNISVADTTGALFAKASNNLMWQQQQRRNATSLQSTETSAVGAARQQLEEEGMKRLGQDNTRSVAIDTGLQSLLIAAGDAEKAAPANPEANKAATSRISYGYHCTNYINLRAVGVFVPGGSLVQCRVAASNHAPCGSMPVQYSTVNLDCGCATDTCVLRTANSDWAIYDVVKESIIPSSASVGNGISGNYGFGRDDLGSRNDTLYTFNTVNGVTLRVQALVSLNGQIRIRLDASRYTSCFHASNNSTCIIKWYLQGPVILGGWVNATAVSIFPIFAPLDGAYRLHLILTEFESKASTVSTEIPLIEGDAPLVQILPSANTTGPFQLIKQHGQCKGDDIGMRAAARGLWVRRELLELHGITDQNAPMIPNERIAYNKCCTALFNSGVASTALCVKQDCVLCQKHAICHGCATRSLKQRCPSYWTQLRSINHLRSLLLALPVCAIFIETLRNI